MRRSAPVTLISVLLIIALGLAGWRLSNPPVGPRLDRYLQNGSQLLGKGHYLGAADMYRRALTLSNKHAAALYGFEKATLGGPFSGLTLVERRTKLQALISRNPTDPHLHMLLGDIVMNEKRIEAALTSYQRALKLDAKNLPHAWHKLGLAFMEQAEWSKSIMPLRKATKLAPEILPYQYDLGFAYEQTNDFTRAAELYTEVFQKNALSLYPRLKYAGVLRLMGHFDRAASVLKFLHWLTPEVISLKVNQTAWRFRSTAGSIFLSIPEEKYRYIAFELALTLYLLGKPSDVIENIESVKSSMNYQLLKLICTELNKLKGTNPSTREKILTFEDEMLTTRFDQGCQLSAFE